jgi:hypothetical protein
MKSSVSGEVILAHQCWKLQSLRESEEQGAQE